MRLAALRTGVDILDEPNHPSKPRLLIVVHRHVTAGGAIQIFAVLDFGGHHLHVLGIHGVVPAADGQGGNGDFWQVGGAIPVQQSAAGAEFAGALHQDVDLRIKVLEGAVDWIWPLVFGHPQYMVDVVMLHEQFHVAGLLVFVGSFQFLDLGQGFLVHLGHKHVFRIFVVGGDAGHHVGDDQAFEMLLVLESVFHRQDAAPGMTEQVEVTLVELECLADLFHFFDEAGGFPEFGLIGLVAVVGAKLIVVVILDAGPGEVAVAGFKVLVGAGRAAVEEENFDLRVVAGTFGPDPERAGGGFDWDEFDAAGEGIVACGVVKVGGGLGGEKNGSEGENSNEWEDAFHASPVLDRMPRFAYSLTLFDCTLS